MFFTTVVSGKNSEILSINIHPPTHMWGWGFRPWRKEWPAFSPLLPAPCVHPERFKIWNPENHAKLKIWTPKTWTEIPVCTVFENHQSVMEWMKWKNCPLERFYKALFWFTYKAKASEIQNARLYLIFD